MSAEVAQRHSEWLKAATQVELDDACAWLQNDARYLHLQAVKSDNDYVAARIQEARAHSANLARLTHDEILKRARP